MPNLLDIRSLFKSNWIKVYFIFMVFLNLLYCVIEIYRINNGAKLAQIGSPTADLLAKVQSVAQVSGAIQSAMLLLMLFITLIYFKNKRDLFSVLLNVHLVYFLCMYAVDYALSYAYSITIGNLLEAIIILFWLFSIYVLILVVQRIHSSISRSISN
ncbi:hypothetical protein ACQKM9_04950 [Viridibacillus sp. NPDC093762]|uniref:hypothetical protein n=1 Tax=Viridibacillus sp. NPDC093762 TaxID=3390720 RepID=UPI003D006A7F